MKKVLLICIVCLFANSSFAYTTWENNPNNWNNSQYNWQNSPNNWNNSPNNWNNSRHNPKAMLIFDNNGNAQGYVVPKANGSGVNIYDLNGNRNNYYNYQF